MNDSLDTALVLLLDTDEKPSKPYRTSPYTVREYAALPYAERLAIDRACDHTQRLIYSLHPHPSGHPCRVGRFPHAARHAA